MDAQCDAGESCANGSCVGETPGCSSNGECTGGQVCIDESCQPCTASSQCPDGFLCANGTCLRQQG
jgi:Cys-rich repeat protein